MSFGPLLRAHRLRAGMTQDELAETSGVSARTISLLETGKRPRPRLTSARVLADALDLGVEAREAFLNTTTSRNEPRGAGAFLPRDLPDFVGRDAELRRLAEREDRAGEVRVTTVDGMAGVGKTAFAVHAAHMLADRYPDGTLYIDLHGFTPGREPVTSALALESLLYLVGAAPERVPPTVDEWSALWRSALAGRRILVLLDNADAPGQVRPLLPGTSGSHVIVTSRRRMSTLDASVPVTLDVLDGEDAVALFEDIVGPHRVHGQREEVESVVELCGLLPLAIRVAATRLLHRPGWTVEWLAGSLLRQEPGVAGVFSSSCRRLDAEQLRLFTLLGRHPRPDFDVPSAAAAADIPPSVAESLLEDLVDHHLLMQPVAGRYVFHDLMRDHAKALTAGSVH
ncbi:helix-turn-helix domain-containing protein [Nocardiopsis alba]|uniref:helix-turn-helix domain-containing protein n=1 Tax=Nocardiopsis alba TaxID=53437 RepID=UPI0033DEBF78